MGFGDLKIQIHLINGSLTLLKVIFALFESGFGNLWQSNIHLNPFYAEKKATGAILVGSQILNQQLEKDERHKYSVTALIIVLIAQISK